MVTAVGCAHRITYNPYTKTKVSPSEQQLKEDKIILGEANKAYAKQQKLNKKNWKQTRQVSMKKKYHHLKKVKKPKSMGWKF